MRMNWFECEECGHSFEELAEKDEQVVECEECGKSAKLTKKEVLHKDGLHYNHVSWSIWQAGN